MLHKLVPIWAPHKETTAFPQPAVESGTTVTLLQSPTVPSVYYSVPTDLAFTTPKQWCLQSKRITVNTVTDLCLSPVSPPHPHPPRPGLFGQGSPRYEDFKGYPGDYDEPR